MSGEPQRPSPEEACAARLRRTVALTVAMGALLILALVNRKLNCEFLTRRVLDALRMRDVLTLFVLAPLGIAIMWDFMGVCGGNARRAISLAFVLGVFLLGLGFGMHEPMLGLAVAGWDKAPGIGPSIVFFKEIPGHWAFFLGMLVTIVALVLAETASPFEKPVPRWAFLTALVSGLAGAVSLYGNEVNDQRTSIDMGVVAFCLALVLATHWRQGWTRLGRIPLTFCFYLVFGLGGAAVYATWLLRALGL